ncbi:MAG: hypothetical protein SCABRO_00292 [Candidatus Scalindua brodae]|uniref:Uncharacterized protein n=1 Tax=Candidatus Scalindua brodae TaxID=237368 RepID=A0A0B0ES35_9BACT|nr:MAG: hypothetical protein SCABRO_00292 [Candidatus Scalindua brodae]
MPRRLSVSQCFVICHLSFSLICVYPCASVVNKISFFPLRILRFSIFVVCYLLFSLSQCPSVVKRFEFFLRLLVNISVNRYPSVPATPAQWNTESIPSG